MTNPSKIPGIRQQSYKVGEKLMVRDPCSRDREDN